MGHTYTEAISPTYTDLTTAGQSGNTVVTDAKYKPNKTFAERRIHRSRLDQVWKSPDITCKFTTAIPVDLWLPITPPIPMLDSGLESLNAFIKVDDCAGNLVVGFRYGDALDANNVIDTSAGAIYQDVQCSSKVSGFTVWSALTPNKGYDNYEVSAGGGIIMAWGPAGSYKFPPPPFMEVLLYYSATETTPVSVTTKLTGNYYRRIEKWQS